MGYLQEFVHNPGQPSETKVKKGPLEVPQPESQTIMYQEINSIFGASLIEGVISRKMAIYINEARRSKYPMVLTGPPLALSKPRSFSDFDTPAMHFPHNDALIITMLIGNC